MLQLKSECSLEAQFLLPAGISGFTPHAFNWLGEAHPHLEGNLYEKSPDLTANLI